MFQEFEQLLSVFNAHAVKYLVVGGYAVAIHAQPRSTKDLDIFIQADPANAKAAFLALAEFGAPLSEVNVEDLADQEKFFRFGNPPFTVDVLSGIEGVEFDEAWSRKHDVIINAQSGLLCHFISREDLITSKLASGRMRDLADVEEIRECSSRSKLDNPT